MARTPDRPPSSSTTTGPPAGTEAPRVNVRRTTAVAGAMFMMAMSAAGPGFITQTATFTNIYGASFAAAIVASIVIDVAIRLNVWRVIGISGLRAQDLANAVIPRAGYVLTVLIVTGGLVFSIGNVAGAGLGLHNLLGLDPRIGASLSAVLAIIIFSYKGLEGTVDRAVIALGAVKIALIAFVAVKTTPSVGEAVVRTFAPRGLDFLPVITLIGGRRGGSADLRADVLDGRHDQHHRRVVHVGVLHADAGETGRPALQRLDRHVHHGRDGALPRHRHHPELVAGLRRRLQRVDPAVRAGDRAVGRLAPPRPAGRVPVSPAAAGVRHPGVGLHRLRRVRVALDAADDLRLRSRPTWT
jgi:hypothetical protein